LWFLSALWLVTSGVVAAIGGCYTQSSCSGDSVNYGRGANEGRLLDANTWESSPVNGPWLPFPHQRFYAFDLHELGDRTPDLILPYVSAQADPTHESGGNATLGSGNLTEISGADTGRVTIHNGTCADYYLRLVVVASPIGTSAAPPAQADASADAPTD
jgi:hypothetical protein